MSREIEFRAWHKKYKYMARVADINFNKERINLNAADIGSYKDIELMQYTGLKDKNGVKIFEGDIIKGTKRSGAKYWEINFIGVVKFTNENKKSKFNIYVNEYREFDFSACFGLEVIGNIYENPELLGGRDE